LNGVNAVGVLYGLEAINAHNGWAISVVGISVVYTGLVTLVVLLSQLHKLVALYDDPGKIKKYLPPNLNLPPSQIPLKRSWFSLRLKNRYAGSITFWLRTWMM
jgi:hypothetical protein